MLPLLHALGQLRGDPALEGRSLEVYRRFPKLQENELTREMYRQLFFHVEPSHTSYGASARGKGRERVIWGARRQQGLLHLHQLTTSPGRPPAKAK